MPGSLVNPVLLGLCSAQCRIFNSAEMTLEQVLSTMEQAEREQKQTVRLHTGDPCLMGRSKNMDGCAEKTGDSLHADTWCVQFLVGQLPR